MNDETPIATIGELYQQSCTELLLAYGLTAELRSDEVEQRSSGGTCFVSALSCTGEGISVLSTLSLDATLLKSVHPARPRAVSHDDLEDWCRELNNQLVGRLKNKLLHFGCELITGLPFLVTGKDISSLTPAGADVLRLSFTSAHGSVVLTLATEISSDFALRSGALSASEEPVMVEGAISLF